MLQKIIHLSEKCLLHQETLIGSWLYLQEQTLMIVNILVLDQDTWDYLGSHEELQIVILGCTDPEAFNYNNQATQMMGHV